MRTPEALNLPTAQAGYNQAAEQQFRRTIENYTVTLRQDVVATRNGSHKSASLGLRRQQFLLMGA